ncbi:hypothetical protein IW261DRAFT_1665447 [Armillaria novae-zelandiae]|uniref:Uncharacterized protein n=1 Tax=Armillaria novae-zelandiae TaxID=153914 RepID=A0AA39NVE8_9AGAR|nr:hypothetical protein IW261DRAFT_1665447 [Armillaria novae-zelandiae]
MVGTFPTFYKITVTSELDQCIRHGQYPATQTVVYRHTPRVPRGRSEGMRPLPSRELLVRCYEAFKHIVLPNEDEANEQTKTIRMFEGKLELIIQDFRADRQTYITHLGQLTLRICGGEEEPQKGSLETTNSGLNN